MEYMVIQQLGTRYRWELYRDSRLVGWGEWRDSSGAVEDELRLMRINTTLKRYDGPGTPAWPDIGPRMIVG